MTTCKFCEQEIFWDKIDGNWVAYNDFDCEEPHRCEDYKPMTDAARDLKRRAEEQRKKEWGEK